MEHLPPDRVVLIFMQTQPTYLGWVLAKKSNACALRPHLEAPIANNKWEIRLWHAELTYFHASSGWHDTVSYDITSLQWRHCATVFIMIDTASLSHSPLCPPETKWRPWSWVAHHDAIHPITTYLHKLRQWLKITCHSQGNTSTQHRWGGWGGSKILPIAFNSILKAFQSRKSF